MTEQLAEEEPELLAMLIDKVYHDSMHVRTSEEDAAPSEPDQTKQKKSKGKSGRGGGGRGSGKGGRGRGGAGRRAKQ